jgi:hypothetical protein
MKVNCKNSILGCTFQIEFSFVNSTLPLISPCELGVTLRLGEISKRNHDPFGETTIPIKAPPGADG